MDRVPRDSPGWLPFPARPGRPIGLLTPLDGEIWTLRLMRGEVAAVQTDWAQVAGPAPGHDVRRALARAGEIIERAGDDVAAGRPPPRDWDDRARAHVRAARRLVVQRQLIYHGRWWPSDRRYFG